MLFAEAATLVFILFERDRQNNEKSNYLCSDFCREALMSLCYLPYTELRCFDLSDFTVILTRSSLTNKKVEMMRNSF